MFKPETRETIGGAPDHNRVEVICNWNFEGPSDERLLMEWELNCLKVARRLAGVGGDVSLYAELNAEYGFAFAGVAVVSSEAGNEYLVDVLLGCYAAETVFAEHKLLLDNINQECRLRAA